MKGADMARERVVTALALWILATLSAAFAYGADRTISIEDVKELAGDWGGSLSGVRGGTVPFTMSVSADGKWQGVSPNAPSNGLLRIESGTVTWTSETTGRRGKITVHEVDGKRVLRLQAEGGVSAELTWKKP
jgi:hypothetical protein